MDYQAKLEQAKRRIDSMIGLPNMLLRKGVARNGDPITGYIDFNWKLLKDTESKRMTLYVEWVDLDGSGNRMVLPHEVVAAVLRAYDTLVTQSRQQGAKAAVETKRRKGVPLFGKTRDAGPAGTQGA